MKLIIDIPEEVYNNIEPFLNDETIKGGFNLFKALDIIKKGIPLDKIKAEIAEERKGYPPSADYYKAINKTLQIIDKHIKDNT